MRGDNLSSLILSPGLVILSAVQSLTRHGRVTHQISSMGFNIMNK